MIYLKMKCQVVFLLLSAIGEYLFTTQWIFQDFWLFTNVHIFIVACKASSVPCEVPCTKEMVPVCGTDGDNFVVFSNACLMNNQKCKDGKSEL